jgi:hypothetical protein
MRLYGIFNLNDNCKLLRYSQVEQGTSTYKVFDYITKTFKEVTELCLPNIEYSEEHIGKNYNQSTDSFE